MGSSIKRIRYRYDSRGNRKALIDQDGGRFTYSYDAVSRITQVINPQGDRTSYSYDAAGRRTVKKLANGARASFSYDNVGNLTRLANLKSDGTTISSFNYKYDEVGNRTSVLEADGSRVTWSYDDTYQLTGEHRTGSHAYRNTFAYDPAGNRTLKNEDGARTTYSYDGANQLTTAVNASGTTTYTFDADGNQEVVEAPSGDRTTMSWDGENRMTSVQQPDGNRNTMAYEPEGLRVKLEESTGTKKFVWDDQNYLAEMDENDDTQVVYTNEPRLYGNLVSQRRGSDSHWYSFDAIGSTRELTDSGETVTDTRQYDAWGTLAGSTGITPAAFWYAGEVGYAQDSESPSVYVRARFYRPAESGWLSADPLREADIVMLAHALQYAGNMPVQITDPSGLDWFRDWVRDVCCTAINLPTQLLEMHPTNGNTAGNVGITIKTVEAWNEPPQECGAFEWIIEWGFASPNTTPPSYILQHAMTDLSVFDCVGESLVSEQREIWEVWQWNPLRVRHGHDPWSHGEGDKFRYGGGGPCTQGRLRMTGEYGLVSGYYSSSVFPEPNPDCAPLTDGACSAVNPGIPTTTDSSGAMRKHEIIVEWNCCTQPAFITDPWPGAGL